MRDYEVWALVRYVVKADSVEEARGIVLDGAEFPLIPFDENNFCDDLSEVVANPLPSMMTATIRTEELL